MRQKKGGPEGPPTGETPTTTAQPIVTGMKIRASSRWTRSATVLPALPISSFSCSGLFTGVRLTETITSPGAHAGRAAAPADVLDDDAARRCPTDFFSSGRQRPHGDAELALGRRRPSPTRRSPCPSSSPTVAFTFFVLPSRQSSSGHRRAGLQLRDHRRQVRRARDRLAVELEDHVAGLDAGLRRRAVLRHRADQRAARTPSGRSSRRATGSLPGSTRRGGRAGPCRAAGSGPSRSSRRRSESRTRRPGIRRCG